MRPEVKIGDVYRNRRGDFVQIIQVEADLADVVVLKFKDTQSEPEYNFWTPSGSQLFRRYQHPNDIIERHQKAKDVLILDKISIEEYPEYFL